MKIARMIEWMAQYVCHKPRGQITFLLKRDDKEIPLRTWGTSNNDTGPVLYLYEDK